MARKFIYEPIEKQCPVCDTLFITGKGSPREKMTCSYSCSNTYFRSGINNPNWKEDSYRSTCFHFHKKECVVCGENKVVEVHHLDENPKNNNSFFFECGYTEAFLLKLLLILALKILYNFKYRFSL